MILSLVSVSPADRFVVVNSTDLQEPALRPLSEALLADDRQAQLTSEEASTLESALRSRWTAKYADPPGDRVTIQFGADFFELRYVA